MLTYKVRSTKWTRRNWAKLFALWMILNNQSVSFVNVSALFTKNLPLCFKSDSEDATSSCMYQWNQLSQINALLYRWWARSISCIFQVPRLMPNFLVQPSPVAKRTNQHLQSVLCSYHFWLFFNCTRTEKEILKFIQTGILQTAMQNFHRHWKQTFRVPKVQFVLCLDNCWYKGKDFSLVTSLVEKTWSRRNFLCGLREDNFCVVCFLFSFKTERDFAFICDINSLCCNWVFTNKWLFLQKRDCVHTYSSPRRKKFHTHCAVFSSNPNFSRTYTPFELAVNSDKACSD